MGFLEEIANLQEALLKAPVSTKQAIDSSSGNAPYIVPPPGFFGFDQPGIIPTPAANGVETDVINIQVPLGYDGVIKKLSNQYTGGGFVEGNGDLTWRVYRNSLAVRNYDNIQVQLGTMQNPRDIAGIRVFSGQVIRVTVTHAVGSGLAVAGTNIICFISGWFYPITPTN